MILMRDFRSLSTCFCRSALTLAVVILTAGVARAADFHVNVMLDLPDRVPGDGICSAGPAGGMPDACTLRAAIMEANALGGPEGHVIRVPSGLYQLTRRSGGILAGIEEDDRQFAGEGAIGNDAWNDLDIGVDLQIVGDSAFSTVIEGNTVDRVFHVLNPDFGRAAPRSVRFAELTIRNGHTMQLGAGVLIERAGEVHFDDVTIADNLGTVFFTNNGRLFWSLGGGIFSRARGLFLTRSTLRNNLAVAGGGVVVAEGWATIRDTTIEDNEARFPAPEPPGIPGGRPGFGGGIALFATETSPTFLVMSGSTLNDNRARDGGGLGAFGGFNIVNSTFSGNTASNSGGGAYVRMPIAANLSLFEFTTIAGNTAGSGGGIHRQPFERADMRRSRLVLSRTIVADNAPENCAGDGLAVSSGNNLDDGNTCGFSGSADLQNTDPRLGVLQNNGGPTFTRALLSTSPAIDRAGMSSWRVDQRGETRPQGRAMDIGAYERGRPQLLVPFPVPDRFRELFGFSIRLELQGTSSAVLKEIVPAMDGLKLSVEIDKSGRSAVVSAFGLKINVTDLQKRTNQKQPALFHVGADSADEGSEFLVITNQRFDATLTDVTKLPFGQK